MRVAVRALLVAVATAGAAAEVWAVHQGWSWVSAALDLLAGWSLVAAAGWAVHVTAGCRMLLGLSGVFWFLATPQVVGGPVGRTAALLGAVWLAPLATALLGAPDAAPARPFSRVASVAVWVRALPALAGIGWLTAATSGLLATAALLDSGRYAVRAPRVAAVLWVSCCVPLACSRRWPGGGRRSSRWSRSAWRDVASPCLTVRSARVATDSGFAGLVVELGETRDATLAGTAARARGRGSAASAAVPAGAGPALRDRLGTARRNHARRPGRHCDGSDRSGGGSSRA